MARRKKGLDIHGIVLLDKRQGISSNKAMQEVKRLYNANKDVKSSNNFDFSFSEYLIFSMNGSVIHM